MNMATGNVFGATAGNAQPLNQTQNVSSSNSWKCSCGATNTSKFCSECGKPKEKKCQKCNTVNTNEAKFCSECGEKL